MMPAVWNVAKPLEVEYKQPIHQSSDQSNSSRKEREKPPCGKETTYPLSLGINPSFAAPSAEVPDVSRSGSTGGSDGDNLMRGRQVTPSGMVPPP